MLRPIQLAVAACAMGFVFCSPILAAITVEGVADKEVYADSVSFRVPAAAGTTDTVTLDGKPQPANVWVEVTSVDYHELFVRRRNQTSGAEETSLTQFIVRSSARGDAEWGLPPSQSHPLIDSALPEFDGAHLRIVAPAQYPQGLEIPVALVGETQEPGARRQ